jgi:hypothetical protein
MQKMNAGEKFDNSKSQQKGEKRGGKKDARFVGSNDRKMLKKRRAVRR